MLTVTCSDVLKAVVVLQEAEECPEVAVGVIMEEEGVMEGVEGVMEGAEATMEEEEGVVMEALQEAVVKADTEVEEEVTEVGEAAMVAEVRQSQLKWSIHNITFQFSTQFLHKSFSEK